MRAGDYLSRHNGAINPFINVNYARGTISYHSSDADYDLEFSSVLINELQVRACVCV